MPQRQSCKTLDEDTVDNLIQINLLLRKIAELKMKDLNASSIEAAMRMIAGTARSMGITVEKDEGETQAN